MITPRARASRKNQAGYVTVLISVLFGLAFTATVLGSAAYIRSTEAVSMASHAQTQAQLKAWTGTEIVREYLAAQQTSGNLTALAAVVTLAPTPLTINGVTGVAATLTAVDNPLIPTQFTAQIQGSTATNTAAAATSTIQAVYSVTTTGASAVQPVLNFNRNLALGGSITVNGVSGTTYSLNVNGDVTTTGNTITGVAAINSTGTINIGSSSSFQALNSDCDVVLTGAVTSVAVTAQRNVCETGGAAVTGTALANGSVSSQAQESANGTIAARASPTGSASCAAVGTTGSGTTATTCPTPPTLGVDLNSGAAGAAYVYSDGNVTLASGTIGRLNEVGNLTLTNYGEVNPGAVAAGVYGGTLTKPQYDTNVNVIHVANNAVVIAPAVAVTLTSTQFNANLLQSTANYAFSYTAAGLLQVQVTNVNGVINGTYYVGNYGTGKVDYICTAVSASSTAGNVTCTLPISASLATKICNGTSTSNSCFSYTTGNLTITGATSGPTLAPGIVWVSGNLTASTGTFYNTFIATGNITTSGADKVYAPNYAGYSGTVGGTTYAPTGICSNSAFPTLYPTQFCNTLLSTFNSTASSGEGNFSFMAGSWTGANYTTQAAYIGGNITLGASSYAYGNIKAGNEFKSGGSTTVAGTVTALAQGTAVQNSMGGSTTFNMNNLPATFSLSGGATGIGVSLGGSSSIGVKWARYL
jgi:hypothetical protein